MSSSTTSIDDLPPEMLCAVFKHLNPRNLAACSLVNKLWHSIYSAFRVHRLAVCDFPTYSWHVHLDRWYGAKRKFEDHELCHIDRFNRLIDKPLLSNLQYLALGGLYDLSSIDLNKLNVFEQLIHLEMHIDLTTDQVGLNLPKLKLLAIHHLGCRIRAYCKRSLKDTGHLSIDCPKLSILLYHGERIHCKLLDVKHPETIRKLDTSMYAEELAQFKNVECLATRRSKHISKHTLLSLPRLKELHFYYSVGTSYSREYKILCGFCEEVGTFEKNANHLGQFLDDVNTLKGSDFKFTIDGLPLTKTMLNADFGVKINEHGKETLYEENVYLKHCHLFEPGTPILANRTIDYNKLMEFVVEEIPACFFQNIAGIRTVKMMHKVSTDRLAFESYFLWFLKSLNSLEELVLNALALSQSFFDQLPASVRLPLKLELKSDIYDSPNYERKELSLNFDFLEKIPRLLMLYVDIKLSFTSLASLVKSLSKLEPGSFDFRTHKIDPEIRKNNYNYF